MARPLRLEFPGAIYHINSRGARQEAIYEDDADRQQWLDILSRVCERYVIWKDLTPLLPSRG
jgi:putative transposase